MKNSILLILTFFLFISCYKQEECTLSSPDSTLQVKIFFDENKKLIYNVVSDNQTVIEDSPLGLVLNDISLSNNLIMISCEILDVKTEQFTMLTGKQSQINETYKEAKLTFENEVKNKMQIIVRAYNTGIAFRYSICLGNTVHTVEQELSGFKLPEGKAWLMPYDDPGAYTPAYEAFYENELDINAQSPTKSGWAFPALFSVNNRWVLVSESDEDENYCSIHLNSPVNRLYMARLPEENDANGMYSSKPQITGDWQSPWRVIIVGKKLSDIFESNLVHALAKPSTIENTDWIEPGIASFSWWWDNDSPEDYNKLKEFVDFGHQMGWKHSLVDAKWDIMQGGNIEQLCQYATNKNVNVWVWYNSGGTHNGDGLGPRDLVDKPEIREKEFERISKLGVKGVKVDYMHSDKQEIIKLYIDILKDAAKYKLMVNFHGCKLPNGWGRTYPNLMTMEAVRGGECYKLDFKYPERAAVCNSILPFTRNVIGPMDYTPTAFSMHKFPHKTSNAHELALSVLFESGIQHLADDYKMYEKQPIFVLNFLKQLPSTWDKSLLLDGYPGKGAVVARKKRDKWFIAGINSEKTPKEYTLKLQFLTESDAQLKLITDGDDNLTFKEQMVEVNSKSEISITMLPEGGFCGIIE